MAVEASSLGVVRVKLKSIRLIDAPPVARFEVDDLSDVVVIAGPNGVGKTRLIQRIIAGLRSGGVDPSASIVVEATRASEATAWAKSELDLSTAEDMGMFTQTLQASRLRRNLTSSLINFESDRTIQNIQPLAFTFDVVDPDSEQVGWDLTFGFMRDRFQDTVHSMYRMIEVQKQSIASRAIQLRKEGKTSMALEFPDPMEPFREVFSSLLAPKELVDPSARAQRLEFRLGDATFDFSALSSGEREVVNIAFDFLLRKPEDCIIFFDEPELHLHPELSYRLLHTLQQIGRRNQFIFSTHSPDIITASLDQSVIFLSPPRAEPDSTPANQAVPVSEGDETNQALRLLGHSVGIVALGRRIVLIEGTEASLDKQTYGSIIGARPSGMVLVPSGGKHEITSFETVYRSVLSKSLWGVEFFMLCDGDVAPPASSAADEAEASGRLMRLPRYHLENYFLDSAVWAKVFEAMEPAGSWLRSEAAIEDALRTLAIGMISYGAALTVSHRIRQEVGNIDVMPKGCHDKSLDEITTLFFERSETEAARAGEVLNQAHVAQLLQQEYVRFQQAADDGEWRRIVPGKPVLRMFATKAQLTLGRAKTMYLAEGLSHANQPFAEVTGIFNYFEQN